jgi:multicomponent Na+:H+ antiporter subunit F
MGPEMLVDVALVMVATALLVAFARVVRGPTLPDRVVAVDLIAVSSAGLMVTAGLGSREPAFLDGAMIIALLGFLGTVAYARYAERERRER